ncbi:MAG: LysR family transcriptional regulator [Phycisphaerales bacterium]
MELTPLRYFRAIAAHGHMTKAARALGVTQPTLSAMLKKLEAEVGADLLHRTGRGVELTEAGRVFLLHAEDAVRRADAGLAAVRQLIGLETGSIRVGGGATATTYLLPPVVSAVRRAHPGLRFYLREAGSNAVAAAVRSGELDMGIVTLPLAAVDAPDLIVIPLVEDEFRLIVPARHRLAGAASFRWKDLAGESVVAFEAGAAVREMIDSASAAAGVTLNVVMELRSIESIKQMVRAGIGVGFVSRFALDEGEGLKCRDGRLARGLALVRRRDRLPSPAGAVFESELLRQLGRRK